MEERRSTPREYLEAIIIAAVFLFFTNTFVVQSFYIPSGSMEPTLLIGDHLFVNRFIYGPAPTQLEQKLLPLRPISRGDVVIFRSPEPPHNVLVKRAIAIPGDTIEIIRKQVFLNGQPLDDSKFAQHTDRRVYSDQPFVHEMARRRDNLPPTVVPPGHYFCLGDNRDHSYDSRFWGPVPSHFIQGRALLIYWSFGGETPDGNWHGWGAKLRQLAKTAAGFVTKTRWERTFQLIR